VTADANIAKGAAIMDIRRKRLAYRANYRGFKEADLILGGFAKAYIETLTENEVTMFEELLTAKDHDIYDWITETAPVPANYDTPLLKRLKAFKPIA
jgi:antitoxin CptB